MLHAPVPVPNVRKRVFHETRRNVRPFLGKTLLNDLAFKETDDGRQFAFRAAVVFDYFGVGDANEREEDG